MASASGSEQHPREPERECETAHVGRERSPHCRIAQQSPHKVARCGSEGSTHEAHPEVSPEAMPGVLTEGEPGESVEQPWNNRETERDVSSVRSGSGIYSHGEGIDPGRRALKKAPIESSLCQGPGFRGVLARAVGPWRDGLFGRSVVVGFGSGCSEVPAFRAWAGHAG
jgi:hypothetical protein